MIPEREAKSISHETTFAQDIDDPEVQRAWLIELAEQVGCRLRRNDLRGRTVHLKVRYSDFRTLTRVRTLPNPTDVTSEIAVVANEMFENLVAGKPVPVRLLGIGISGFHGLDQRQLSLFNEGEHQTGQRMDATADEIRKRFGHDALTRGSSLLHKTKHRPQPRPDD